MERRLWLDVGWGIACAVAFALPLIGWMSPLLGWPYRTSATILGLAGVLCLLVGGVTLATRRTKVDRIVGIAFLAYGALALAGTYVQCGLSGFDEVAPCWG